MPLLVGLADLEPLLTVGLVLGATLIGLAWLSKHARASGGARKSVSLTGQHAVHVIELDGERLLIGTGPSGAPRLLTRLPAAVLEPVASAVPSRWVERLIDAWGAMRG